MHRKSATRVIHLVAQESCSFFTGTSREHERYQQRHYSLYFWCVHYLSCVRFSVLQCQVSTFSKGFT